MSTPMPLPKIWPAEITQSVPSDNKALFAGIAMRDGYSFPVMDIHFAKAADAAFIENFRDDLLSSLGKGNAHICDTSYRERFLQLFVTNPEKARLHQQTHKLNQAEPLVPITI